MSGITPEKAVAEQGFGPETLVSSIFAYTQLATPHSLPCQQRRDRPS
jgi:hypothetical protein